MDIEIFKTILTDFFRFSITKDNRQTLEVFFREVKAKTKKSDLKRIFDNLSNFQENGETELYNSNKYEVVLGFDNSRPFYFHTRDRDEIIKEDEAEGIKYALNKPSDEYLIFLLEKIYSGDRDVNKRPFFFSHRIDRLADDGEIDLLDLLKIIFPRFLTLKIEKTVNTKRLDFEKLCYSFLFNLSYNLDISILPLRFVDEFTRSIRIRRIRRASVDEIEIPKRIYINDLTLHYQKAISSDSFEHQYLSFYHIIEHFFEKIYNEEIINEIKNKITLPAFSYKRNSDIKQLISIIQKKLKYKNDEFLINEAEALRLTLAKFIVDFEELKNELNDFDPNLVEYYKTTEVPFSKGNKVNFEISDIDDILKNLSLRIYKTRNSIVHSKETDKNIFLPYRDDKYILKEIHLMRLIAEKIIIGSSSII